MYYVEEDSNEESYNVWMSDRDDFGYKFVKTTKLVGPFKYRKDVEDYMGTNEVRRVIQID